MTTVLGNPGSGAGRTTLQQAYDNDPTDAQILLTTVPDPVAVRAAVAGDVFLVQDLASNNILQVTSNPDEVEVDGALTVVDAFLNGAAVNSITLTDNVTYTAPFIGGGILSNGTVGFTNSVWIWALLQESKVYQVGVDPGFAAFTLFNALAVIENSGNFNLVQALILNNGLAHRRVTSGTSTTTQTVGLNNSPSTRTTVVGAIMTKTTGDNAVRHAPTYSTVGFSTVNMGTQRGLWCSNPNVALFQPAAGTENMTAYIGVEQDAITFGGNVTKRALRSGLTAATNTLMIENTGGAASDFGAGGVHFDDNTPVQWGGAAFNSQDASLFWAPAGYLSMFFIANSDDIQFSNPSNGQLLIDVNANEFTFNTTRGFSLGAQTGTLGNQFGNFVTGARTIGVGGDWSDFLLTQGGNLTVGGLAMGRVSAWVINPISYASSSGSVGNADTLTVGGFPTSSPGVTITDRQSLYVIGGRSRHASTMQYDPINPAALASGNNNDWAGLLTGSANNNMRHWARISGDAVTSVITGIDATAAQDGDSFELTNISANTINITNQDAASLAANRIITGTGATYVLAADETVIVRYDTTTARWRLLAGTGA
jgi:hypothetical protein